MEQMFEPFFTTKPFVEGAGLGLSSVHGIVEKCNGFINVHSEINNGTIFDVFFPAYKIQT